MRLDATVRRTRLCCDVIGHDSADEPLARVTLHPMLDPISVRRPCRICGAVEQLGHVSPCAPAPRHVRFVVRHRSTFLTDIQELARIQSADRTAGSHADIQAYVIRAPVSPATTKTARRSLGSSGSG